MQKGSLGYYLEVLFYVVVCWTLYSGLKSYIRERGKKIFLKKKVQKCANTLVPLIQGLTPVGVEAKTVFQKNQLQGEISHDFFLTFVNKVLARTKLG